MAAEGADLAGEARLLDAMVPRRSRVLDAGCGPGGVGAELAARGHLVVGVDADEALIGAAHCPRPGLNL
jgi:2-polyprenyl-3-methyl-5-hydroxy-6-metoxy-1,4-benzoquinol methylase